MILVNQKVTKYIARQVANPAQGVPQIDVSVELDIGQTIVQLSSIVGLLCDGTVASARGVGAWEVRQREFTSL